MDALPSTLLQFADLVQEHPTWELPVLLATLSTSAPTLHRQCRRFLGISARQWLLSYRMRSWRIALQEQGDVLESALQHFGALSSAYRHAAHALGMSPASLRRGGAGAWLAYGIAPCELGNLVVAQSEKGVSWVCVQGDAERFTTELCETYPHAHLVRMDERFAGWIAALLGERPQLALARALPEPMLLAALQQHLLAFVLRQPIPWRGAAVPSIREAHVHV